MSSIKNRALLTVVMESVGYLDTGIYQYFRYNFSFFPL